MYDSKELKFIIGCKLLFLKLFQIVLNWMDYNEDWVYLFNAQQNVFY